LVTVTLQYREPGIFGEAVVGERELAEEENRSAIRLHATHLHAGRANADGEGFGGGEILGHLSTSLPALGLRWTGAGDDKLILSPGVLQTNLKPWPGLSSLGPAMLSACDC
jgi:hypothetical protein